MYVQQPARAGRRGGCWIIQGREDLRDANGALRSRSFTLTPADTQYAATMFSMVADSIGAGIHLPARSSNFCSRKYCAHWRACEAEFGGHVRE